jgi:SAM-dependent methyltransferase
MGSFAWDSRQLADLLRKLGDTLGQPAKDTLLYENLGKHLFEMQLLSRHLRGKSRSVVDIGGGLGVNLTCLAQIRDDFDLSIIDSYEEYVPENRMGTADAAVATMQSLGIEVVAQDFWSDRRLPWEDASFDVATIFDVLEHLSGHPLYLLEEAFRILRPGGVLILGGPNAIALMRRVRLLIGQHPYIDFEAWLSDSYYGHFREYTRQEYVELVARVGFHADETHLVQEPTRTRAKNRYHNGHHSMRSPVPYALLGAYALEQVFARLRPAVYVVASR